MLVAGELADIGAQEELTYLLSDGLRWSVRVLAATADGGVERAPILDLFSSHLVFRPKGRGGLDALAGDKLGAHAAGGWQLAGAVGTPEGG